MATLSAIAAVIERLKTFSGLPAVYSFDAPPSVADAQQYPPYIVVIDNGMRATYEFQHTCMEQTDVQIMVYADRLSTVDQIVERIKYNGGSMQAGLGLDYGPLPTLDPSYQDLEVHRHSEQRFITEPTGKSAQRIFVCDMRYRVSLYRYTAN